MISEEKKAPVSAEKRPKSLPKALATITSSFSNYEKAILDTLLRRGLQTEDSGTGSDDVTFEELKVLWKFVENSTDKNTFTLCEWCRKVYVLGEAIRDVHGKEHADGKPCPDPCVRYGKAAVLGYLDMLIEGGMTSRSNRNGDRGPKLIVDLPRMGLVRSPGKFESFPQNVVLWCRALGRSEAEERLAFLLKGKQTWLKTMAKRLNLHAGSTAKDVKEYLEQQNPRFFFTHAHFSEEDISFWIRVAGHVAVHGASVSTSFKQNLDTVVGQLGKRCMPAARQQERSDQVSDSESGGCAEPKVPKKQRPTFQSALSAISKTNGGKKNKQVADEEDPEKKMKMLMRRLGGTDPILPSPEWTAGIDEAVLSGQIGAIRKFLGCLDVSLPAAVRLLNSATAPRHPLRQKKGTGDEVYCFPAPPSKLKPLKPLKHF
jgi:hypothetical protein